MEKNKKIIEERKIFYYHDEKDKPIYAAGILFVRNNKSEVLIQKLPKDDGDFQYTDFGGKNDLTDETVMDTISRELGEEINYGIFTNSNKEFLDNKQIKKIIQDEYLEDFYIPYSKYMLSVVNFNDRKLGLDMELIGLQETLDNIKRSVQWITAKEFINAHFEHHLHPRLWGKHILEFLGYDGHFQPKEDTIIKKPTKFAFK